MLPRPCTLLTVLAASLATACTAVQPGVPREWLEVRGGVYDLRPATAGPVDDAFGWSLGGGYDLNSDPLRVSWELAGAWAQHDVEVAPTSLDGQVEIDVVRVSTGLRATMRLRETPLGAYAHGGVTWRAESSNDPVFPGNDQWGTYVGFGLEWWYAPNATLGPALWRFEGDEDGLEETWLGLVARFY